MGCARRLLAGDRLGAWQLRLRQLRRQFSLVLGERVRLSRELHDTLLQSLVGVALEFDAISKSLDTSPASAKARVVKIRERVEEYIREARRSIWSLRSPALETGDLVDALREGADARDFRSAGRTGIQRERRAAAVCLRRRASAAAHRPGGGVERRPSCSMPSTIEHATSNSRRARPSSCVSRTMGAGSTGATSVEGTTDHYGITTMRERAEQVGGHVTITSAARPRHRRSKPSCQSHMRNPKA